MKRALYAFGVIGLSLFWGVPSEAAVNLALSGTASQSSTFPDGEASRCIDGNTNGDWVEGSVCHTESEKAPFWQVQLTGDFLIDNIVVWNRTDCCEERLGIFTVAIFDDANQVWSATRNYNDTDFTIVDADHLKLDIGFGVRPPSEDGSSFLIRGGAPAVRGTDGFNRRCRYTNRQTCPI